MDSTATAVNNTNKMMRFALTSLGGQVDVPSTDTTTFFPLILSPSGGGVAVGKTSVTTGMALDVAGDIMSTPTSGNSNLRMKTATSYFSVYANGTSNQFGIYDNTASLNRLTIDGTNGTIALGGPLTTSNNITVSGTSLLSLNTTSNTTALDIKNGCSATIRGSLTLGNDGTTYQNNINMWAKGSIIWSNYGGGNNMRIGPEFVTGAGSNLYEFSGSGQKIFKFWDHVWTNGQMLSGSNMPVLNYRPTSSSVFGGWAFQRYYTNMANDATDKLAIGGTITDVSGGGAVVIPTS
jgi:hypothetical protein